MLIFKDFAASTVGNRNNARYSSETCSLDLTEALDPEWYFRDQSGADDSNDGLLKSPGPGQIRKVGFGKQKVAFIDVLGTEHGLTARRL